MSNAQGHKPTRDRGRDVRLILITLAAVLLVWFVVGNTQSVNIHFWVTSADTSLIAVIVISAALGAVIALLLSRSRRRK